MDDVDHANRLTDFEVEQRLAAIRAENKVVATRPGPRAYIDCSDPIEPDRLTAKPDAKRCVFCQAAAERAARTYRPGASA